MAKTLRVRTRTGWVTKPVADVPENRLIAEEVDDNFLALEDAIANISVYEIGYSMLVPRDVDTPGWLPMNGLVYQNADYPVLGGYLGGVYLYQNIQPHTLTAPGAGEQTIGQFSPDGKYYSWFGRDGTPYYTLVDTATWAAVASTISLPNRVFAASYTKRGDWLAIGGLGGYGRVYDTATETLVASPNTPNASDVTAMAFSPDGEYLAMTTQSTPYRYIFRTSDWGTEGGLSAAAGSGRAVAWSRDSSKVAFGHQQATSVDIVNRGDWAVDRSVGGTNCFGIDWSHDGTRLAVTDQSVSPYLFVYDLSDWSSITVTAPGDSTALHDCSFSQDDKYLAAQSWTGSDRLHVYDTSDWTRRSGLPLANVSNGGGTNGTLDHSPNNRYLAVCSSTGDNLTFIEVYDETKFIVPTFDSPSPQLEWRIKAEDV